MCDILRGNGFLAEPTSVHSATDVEVIFCNPDLLWKNEWEGPRLGQGGFRKAWEGVWSVGHIVFRLHSAKAYLFGQHLKMGQNDPVITQLGKPTRETYSFAADVLREVSDELDVKLTFGSSDDVGTLGRSSSNMYVRIASIP
jgi:ribonucleotide monophosphatase NagD (HAD superfamily)